QAHISSRVRTREFRPRGGRQWQGRREARADDEPRQHGGKRATGREEGGHGPQISTLRAEPIEPRIPHGSSEVTQIAADVRANEVGGRDVSSPTRGSREGR